MTEDKLNIALMRKYIQQLTKLDHMIALHRQYEGDATAFMTKQYEHQKEELLKEVIVELGGADVEHLSQEKIIFLFLLLSKFIKNEITGSMQENKDSLLVSSYYRLEAMVA